MNISVIIPAYNEEKRLAACLSSVFDQTKVPDEVIVIDNASTDRTAQIAREMGARVVEEKRRGITFARNAGFNSAKFEIIARTDADTIVPKNWVETISQEFEKDTTLVALSGPAVFGLSIFSPLLKILVFEANKKIFGHYGLYGPNLAIKKSAWEKIESVTCVDDSKVHEDTDLAIHIGKIGEIGYVPGLKVRTSARRLRHSPSSQLVEYIVKWADMIAFHKEYRITKLASNIKQKMNN